MPRIDDPELVRAGFASEEGLLGRRAASRYATGPDAPQMLFEAIAELNPNMDAGCWPWTR
jgi:hypothetical protein